LVIFWVLRMLLICVRISFAPAIVSFRFYPVKMRDFCRERDVLLSEARSLPASK
jgi:hypothetical protein